MASESMRVLHLIPVLALSLACDSSRGGCAGTKEEMPLVDKDAPHTGKPLELSVDDLPLTFAQMVEVAHYYHPKMRGLEFDSSAALDRYLAATPEERARIAVHKRASANSQPWRDFVQALAEHLPGHLVSDMTRPYLIEPTFAAIIGVPENSEGHPEHRVVVMASMLAPVYHLYETHGLPQRIRSDFSESAAAIATLVEGDMQQRFGYQRINAQQGAIYLPGLQIGTRPDERSTLIDALFTDYRW